MSCFFFIWINSSIEINLVTRKVFRFDKLKGPTNLTRGWIVRMIGCCEYARRIKPKGRLIRVIDKNWAIIAIINRLLRARDLTNSLTSHKPIQLDQWQALVEIGPLVRNDNHRSLSSFWIHVVEIIPNGNFATRLFRPEAHEGFRKIRSQHTGSYWPRSIGWRLFLTEKYFRRRMYNERLLNSPK